MAAGPWTNTPGNARCGQTSFRPTCWSDDLYDYALVTRRDWHPVVWRRPAGGGSWESYDISGTAIGVVDATDSHMAVVMAVDHLKRIWVAGNTHATNHRVIVSAPGSITSWSEWPRPSWFDHSPVSTYQSFDCFSDGQILWAFSSNEGPSTGMGRDWSMLRMNVDTDEWEPVLPDGDGRLMRVDDPGTADDDKPNRSYMYTSHVDGRDRLHAVGVWRFEGGATMQRCWYACSDDRGATWRNVHGDPITTPLYYETTILAGEAEILVDGNSLGSQLGGPMCTDATGHPVWTGLNFDGDGYFLCRWTGTEWTVYPFAWQGWPTITTLPSVALRHDGALLAIWRDSNGRLVAYNFDEGPTTTDRVMLGNVDIGTPDGDFEFESGATYIPAPAAATWSPYRRAVQVMVPDGDTPVIRSIGAGAVAAAPATL